MPPTPSLIFSIADSGVSMYIVCFNGPPQSGKDTMARMLAEHMDSQQVVVPVREVSPTTDLYKIARVMTGWDAPLSDKLAYEEFKKTHFPMFNRTGRELMIDVSDLFLRPYYGEAIKPKMMLNEFKDFHGLLINTSLGFQVEVPALIDAVGVANVYIARVHRAGCDFENDSREWVTHVRSYAEHDYFNDGTLDDLRTEAGRIYGRLVNQMGWKL